MLREIRNPDRRLICRIGETSDGIIVEIQIKGIITTITLTPEGKVRITHTRKQVLNA